MLQYSWKRKKKHLLTWGGSFTSYVKNDAGSDLIPATCRGEAKAACKNKRGFLWLVWHFVKSDTIIQAGLDTAALWAM